MKITCTNLKARKLVDGVITELPVEAVDLDFAEGDITEDTDILCKIDTGYDFNGFSFQINYPADYLVAPELDEFEYANISFLSSDWEITVNDNPGPGTLFVSALYDNGASTFPSGQYSFIKGHFELVAPKVFKVSFEIIPN